MKADELYQKEITNIIACLNKLASAIPTEDNINFINSLKEYEEDIKEFMTLIVGGTK